MASKVISMFSRAIISTTIKLKDTKSIFGLVTHHRKIGTDDVIEKSLVVLPPDNVQKLAGDLDALAQEVKILKLKNEDLLHKYEAVLANSDKLKHNLTKQVEDAKLCGMQGFCKDLVEVADMLCCATEAVLMQERSENNPHLKDLYDGLTLTQATLLHVFKKHGLQQIDPINQKFDANLHEAVFQKPVDDVEPNTVVKVCKIGYQLYNRCIRLALVGISKET